MTKVKKLLLLQGYLVEEGELVFLNTSQAKQVPFPNVESAYGGFNFPSFFDQPSVFRLAGSDAILFHGCTPPQVVYFGFRSYLSARVISQNIISQTANVTFLLSDMGDTVNSLSIKTSNRFGDPFDQLTTYVTTGDHETYDDIKRAFTLASFDLAHTLNLDVIPSATLDLIWSANILQTPRDSFSVALRVVLGNDDSVEYLKYLQTPQKVYYIRSIKGLLGHVSPRVPMPLVLRNATTGFSEESVIGGCLNDLVNSIKAMMAPNNYELIAEINEVSKPGTVLNEPKLSAYLFNWGIYCIENDLNCFLPNRDTLYGWIPQAFLLQDNLFYFVVGVNHNQLGTTVYNSVTNYYVLDPTVADEIYTPINSMTNFQYEQYDFTDVIPSGQCSNRQRQNLFVIQVARPANCISGIASLCITETQLATTEPFVFFSRAHLNPKTATHPDPNETIFPRVLVFRQV